MKYLYAGITVAVVALVWFVRAQSLKAPVSVLSTYKPTQRPSPSPISTPRPTAVPATATPSPDSTGSPQASPISTPTPTPSATPLSVSSQIENKLIVLTNAERAKNNLPPLKATQILMTLARSHSQEMATHNYFSHTDLNGGSPSDRAAKIGIPNKQLSDGSYLVGVAENIGLITASGMTADGVARMQITNWMNSPGHRANILDPRFTEIGIGVGITATSYYSTQNFR